MGAGRISSHVPVPPAGSSVASSELPPPLQAASPRSITAATAVRSVRPTDPLWCLCRTVRAVRPRALLFRVVTGLHRAVFRVTGGRLLGRAGGMPVVILTTTGRRSGRRRATMLTAPVIDGERLVLVASYGGHSHNPHWYQNLLVQPDVGVTMGGSKERPMRARVANREERAELWPRVVSAYPGYERYQQRTGRLIPLVLVEPYAVHG